MLSEKKPKPTVVLLKMMSQTFALGTKSALREVREKSRGLLLHSHINISSIKRLALERRLYLAHPHLVIK